MLKIKRFTRLSPFLYRGSVPRSHDLPSLHHLGIRSIVDFQALPNWQEKILCEHLGLRYFPIPWTAHVYRALAYRYVFSAAQRFLEVLSHKENLPVYVHCYHGRERTGTMIAVYRMAVDGWSYQKAREEMLSYGVNRWLHFSLFLFLKRFYRSLETAKLEKKARRAG